MTYPPSYEEAKKIFAELKRLDDEVRGEYCARKYEIIHDIAEAKYFEAKDYLIAGLDDSDPDYRLACISALTTHWLLDENPLVDKLIVLAKDD